MPRDRLIQLRRDTAANWTSENPVLESGEFGWETDTNKAKLGDSSTVWSSLAYITNWGTGGGGGSTAWGDITGTLSAQTDLQAALDAKAAALGADDNYVTDAEKVVISNTSGANTGDQDLSGLQPLATVLTDTTASFTTAQETKLSNIETAADVTDEANVVSSLDGAALTPVTANVADKVIIQDDSDSDNIKTVTAQSIADMSATNNFYSSIAAPQLFNPDASGVSGDTEDFTLINDNGVSIVTVNGQVIDDSEYALTGTTLTVSPDNGFNSTADEVLVFQESFVTTTTSLVRSSVIIVQQASDFGTIDSTKTYYIDGVVDMGTTSIEVPEGGITIFSDTFNAKGIFSTADNYTMFTTPVGGNTGDIEITQCFLATNGASSKIFDVDNDSNFSAVELVNVNVGNFGYGDTTEIGDISNYRQFRADGCAFINCDDGITFNGTMVGGIAVTNSIALSLPAMTLFKEGTSLLVQGSVRSNLNFLSVAAAAIAFDFTSANIENDAQFGLINFRTGATDVIPNILSSDTKVKFKDCVGIRNTYVGGQYKVTTETETVISVINTPVKMAGTTTYSDLAWFSGSVDNAFTYSSSQPVEIQVTAAISLSGGNNNQVNVILKKWDDSASSYVDISESGAVTMNNSGRAEGVSVLGFSAVDENDRIEVWVENQTGTSNITGKLGGLVAVTERPS